MNERFVLCEGRPGINNLVICLDADFWIINKYNILDDVRALNGAHLGDRIFWFKRDCERAWFLLKWN